jgi:MFS family permease
MRDAPATGGGEPNRGPIALMAVPLFVVSGVIHYQTPMLAAMGAEFGADAAAVGWVATLSFGGFLAGMIFLIPLGDRLDKRQLVLAQITALIPALLAMAAAPSLVTLAAASFVVGVCASLGQHFISMAAELTRPAVRGHTLGTMLTALFLGILFARITGGLVAAYIGWRWMYAALAIVMLALTPVLARRLPSMPAKTRIAYRPLLWSLVQLVGRHEVLRRVSANQLLLGDRKSTRLNSSH